MSRMVATGYATPAGLLLRCGDGLRLVEPTRTPLGVAVREACDGILRGDVEPCACGKFACDCDEWHEIMNGINAAERGELGDYESELPY